MPCTPSNSICLNRNFAYKSECLKCKLACIHDKPCSPCNKPPVNNADEIKYKNYSYNGSYHKGFQHDANGTLGSTTTYDNFKTALLNNDQVALSAIPMATGYLVKQTNPLASLSTALVGAPYCRLFVDAPPSLSSPAGAAEMVELYSMMIARDVPFTSYAIDATITNVLTYMNASDVLCNLPDYTPKCVPFTPTSIFRGITTGDKLGPYVSQLLLLNVPMGGLTIPQTYLANTTRAFAISNSFTVEWGRNHTEMVNLQNTTLAALPPAPASIYINPAYIHDGRSLAEAVHSDPAYCFYLNASLILSALGTSWNSGFQQYANQTGFITATGGPNVHTALAEVTRYALGGAWFWKWQAYRRVRPEAFGMYVDNIKNAVLPNLGNYNISDVLMNNSVLTGANTVNASYGVGFTTSYTLNQCYREGSPTHPAYPSGHATIAGACATILKIFYADGLWSALPGISTLDRRIVPSSVVTGPLAESDATGMALVDYTGSSAGVTIWGEIDKMASNVAFGRNWSGVHYRTDAVEGMLLGEKIAINYMEDLLSSMVENNLAGTPPQITFTKFNGESYTVKPTVCKGVKINLG